MANSKSINGNTDMINNEIAHETLDDIIIEAISTIPLKIKRPDVNSIFEHLNKELYNSNINSTLTDTRLITLSINGKLEIKYPLEKASCWVKSNNVLESCKSKTLENNPKTPTSSTSLPSPMMLLAYISMLLETLIAL